MAIKSLIFDYQTAEDEYTASDFREVYKHFVSNGVLLEKEDSLLDNTKCKVVAIEGGVRISNGTAQINGSQAIITDEDILIETDGTYKIILEWNLVLNGFSIIASQEELTRTDTVYQLQLATVVKSGTSYTITDTRNDSSLCGYANRMLDNQADALQAQIENGWNELAGTFTYHSKDSSTATNGTMYTVKLTTSIDLTQLAELGCRFKFSHDGVVKYGILVAKDATSITLLLKLGTSVLDGAEAITGVYFSPAKCPVGFSVNPNDWTIRALCAEYAGREATANVWIEPHPSFVLKVLAGAYNIKYCAKVLYSTSGEVNGFITLSTASATESDHLFTRSIQGFSFNGQNFEVERKGILLSSPVTYHINVSQDKSGALYVRHQDATGVIEAICAYL